MTDTPSGGPSGGVLGGRRLLVVEDEYFLADDLGRGLRRTGAVVVGPVGSVREALALIEAEPRLDAAVLDVNLGGEAVYPVADVLAARGVPYVFTTGYDTADLPAGYQDVPRCEKPTDVAALARILAGRMG